MAHGQSLTDLKGHWRLAAGETQALIAIIVVNYRKPELCHALCDSLARAEGANALKVIIVDNGANDDSRRKLASIQESGLNVEVLFESTNWGYFGGARRGLQRLNELGLRPDWVIVSNSDIEFPDRAFFTKLAFFRKAADIGVLAPKILSGLSGWNQNPLMANRPKPSKMHFYKWMFRYRPTCWTYQMLGLTKSLVKRGGRGRQIELGPTEIYAAHGAFLIFSKRYFDSGGSFDHKPFLFGEEITIAETCRRLSLKIRYEPSLTVAHSEHATIGWFPNARMLAFQKEASEFCADTYFPIDRGGTSG